MLLQITLDYAGLPDPRTLSLAEIRFFYEGLRAGLMRPLPKVKNRGR